MTVLFIGAGAVNLSLIAWADQSRTKTYLLARGAAADLISADGVAWRMHDGSASGTARPTMIRSLGECSDPDMVVIGVKAYDLPLVAQEVAAAFGPDVPVVSLQNGVEHRKVLNSIFSRTVLMSVWYNARKEDARTVVAVSRGPISIAPGNPGGLLAATELTGAYGDRMPVVLAPSALDMLRCKLVINLSNSLVSLIGLHRSGTEDPRTLQRILAAMLYEGLTVLRTAGVEEVRVPGAPTWLLISLNHRLPAIVTAPIFRRKLAKMSVSSMAQDLDAHPESTELEEINGAFVHWADELKVPVPVNKAVLSLCRQRFGQGFVPMSMTEVAAALTSAA
jgi:2-dehydropantoate 2-reductase